MEYIDIRYLADKVQCVDGFQMESLVKHAPQ